MAQGVARAGIVAQLRRQSGHLDERRRAWNCAGAHIKEAPVAEEPINLNRARKAKARAEGEARAAGNRVKFGRTKGEKLAAKLEAERLRSRLDQARRDD
jgi:hypothetical protein